MAASSMGQMSLSVVEFELMPVPMVSAPVVRNPPDKALTDKARVTTLVKAMRPPWNCHCNPAREAMWSSRPVSVPE